MARVQGARTILEIGTLGDYSAIWLARALPADGRLVTLEADKVRRSRPRQHCARWFGGCRCVDLRLGRALDTRLQLAAEGSDPFDLMFIDADKPSNPAYFAWALKLSRCDPASPTPP